MTIVARLQRVGYSRKDARKLGRSIHFCHKEKTAQELRTLIEGMARTYGCSEEIIRENIAVHPQFANHDHEKRIDEIDKFYSNRYGVIDAIIRCPQFADRDHAKVIREKTRLGAIVGLPRETVIGLILQAPMLAIYSTRRYIAGLEVCRRLNQEGFERNEGMLQTYFERIRDSPYIPGRDRVSMSEAPNAKSEPALLINMRSCLQRMKKES